VRLANGLLVTLIAAGGFGCGGPKIPEPPSPMTSAIGVSVKIRLGVRLFTYRPDVVYFVRLDDTSDGPEAYVGADLKPSNYEKDGQVYLLNVVPGRYAAVGTFKKRGAWWHYSGESRSTVLFSADLRRSTEVTVESGQFVFMGDFVVDETRGKDEADQVAMHLLRLIAEREKRGWLPRVLSHDMVLRGALYEVHRERETELEFLGKAERSLGKRGWSNVIRRRLESLQSP
jgi:hypothetical protein